MTLCVNSTAKASDDSPLDVGDGTDNAPRSQLVFIAHKDSVRLPKCDRAFGFDGHDTRPEQALPVQSEQEFTRRLLVSGLVNDLYKTLRNGHTDKRLLTRL
jgi:hypothetical protein